MAHEMPPRQKENLRGEAIKCRVKSEKLFAISNVKS